MKARSFGFALAACLALGLSGCGGGGGGGSSTSTPTSSTSATSGTSSTSSTSSSTSTITGYLVDGPVQGLSYACAPSGLSGTTSATGSFSCNSGDTVTFSLSVGSSTISLGSVAVPSTTGVSIPVTMLPDGLQVAEILQALNHGTTANIDVSGLTVPAAVVADINSYISSGGTLPSGQASDDGFLAYVQSQTTGATLTTPVTGSAKTFQQTTVLPNLQTTIAAISATNPPPPVSTTNTTKLSGTIVVNGSGTVQGVAGCTSPTVTETGGAIVNAVVSGDISKAGTYPVAFTFSNFEVTTTIGAFSCTAGGQTVNSPQSTSTDNTPFIGGNDTVTVTPAFSGNNLSLGSNSTMSGCTGGAVTGTDVGASNPLITLSTTITCNVAGGTYTTTATLKLVGAW